MHIYGSPTKIVPESATQLTPARMRTQEGSKDGDCRATLDTVEDITVDVSDGTTPLLDINDEAAPLDEVVLAPIDSDLVEFEQALPSHTCKAAPDPVHVNCSKPWEYR